MVDYRPLSSSCGHHGPRVARYMLYQQTQQRLTKLLLDCLGREALMQLGITSGVQP